MGANCQDSHLSSTSEHWSRWILVQNESKVTKNKILGTSNVAYNFYFKLLENDAFNHTDKLFRFGFYFGKNSESVTSGLFILLVRRQKFSCCHCLPMLVSCAFFFWQGFFLLWITFCWLRRRQTSAADYSKYYFILLLWLKQTFDLDPYHQYTYTTCLKLRVENGRKVQEFIYSHVVVFVSSLFFSHFCTSSVSSVFVPCSGS